MLEKEKPVYLSREIKAFFSDFWQSMDLVSDPKLHNMVVSPSELVQKSEESEADYIKRVKLSLENQFVDMQDLCAINAIMTEALEKIGGVSVETLEQDLEQISQRLDLAKSEKAKFEKDARIYGDLNEKCESVLDMQSRIFNGLEESEEEISLVQVKKDEARKEKEAKVNSLLVCISQEQTKSEKLIDRLLKFNEDVDRLLEGIGDEVEFPEEGEDNAANSLFPQEVEENGDDSELPQESGDDSELPRESEENEVEENGDDSELLQESEEKEENEEIEDDSELPQENEEVEDEENGDDSGLLQESEENEDEAELSEEDKNYASTEDSSMEHILDCVRNGKRHNRNNAVINLTNVLYTERVLEFLALDGLPLLMSVLQEHSDDSDLAFYAFGCMNNAVVFTDGIINNEEFRQDLMREINVEEFQQASTRKINVEEFQQASMSFHLLSRDVDNISLILSSAVNYVNSMAIEFLRGLFSISPDGLRETILAIPQAITKLMDNNILKNSEIRLSIFKFLNGLADQSEEIQNIILSEGVFEKIFGILEEIGGLNCYPVVEECFRLLNILLFKNEANQKLLRETVGFSTFSSAFKLQDYLDFDSQMGYNVYAGLKTINILITENSEPDPEKDSNSLTNKMALVQANILDHLLTLGVEIENLPVAIRCSALRCIGDLICGHPKHFASKVIGEKPIELALNSILRLIFKTSSTREFVAADYVFKRFFEKNSDRQAMLAPTLASIEDNISFGSILLQGFRDLETSCRAASVLSHILEDNNQLKKKVLAIKFEEEPIMQLIVKHLVLASFMRVNDGDEVSEQTVNSCFGPIFSKLLVIWLEDCPEAVSSFMDSCPGLTYLLDCLSNESESEYTNGLASVIFGQCVIYNEATEGQKDSFTVVRRISQKIGFKSYFLKLDEMDKTNLFASVNNSVKLDEKNKEDNVVMSSIFDTAFVTLVKKLDSDIREKLVELNVHPKSNEALARDELEQKSQESETKYINRLKESAEKQCIEIQEILASNEIMASDLKNASGITIEELIREIREKSQELKLTKSKKSKIQLEAFVSRKLSDSDKLLGAMNYVQSKMVDYRLLMSRSELPDVEAIKAESKADSLTIWLGYEQRKVERLRQRLLELGENVDNLLGDEVS